MKSAEKRSSGGGSHPSRSHQQVPSKVFVPGAELNNRWTILQVIGKGAFSEILAAKDNNPSDDTRERPFVAIKIQTACLERSVLKSEAVVLRELSGHPFFPKFYAFHESSSNNDPEYIVMEYLCGEDMATIRNRSRSRSSTGLVPLCIASYLVRNMIQGLREMHRVGFVHRDVKPSNFVRRNDKTTQFCVIDFGLTKLYRERTGQLRPEKPHADFRGTTVYASPFVHSGHDQCPRDDLLSALHVFFDMIIGKLPWGDAARSKDKITAAATKKNMYVHPDEFIGWLCEEVSAKSPTALEVNFPSQTRIIALSIILKLANLKYADVPDYDWLDKQFEEMVPEAQRQDIGDINFSFEGFNWHETSSRSATFMATAMSRYSVSGVGNDFVSPIPFSGEKARNVSLSGRQNWDKTILFADDSHRLSSSNLPTIATGWNDGNGIDGAVANASETLTPLLSAGVHRSTSDRDLSNIHLYNEKLRSYTATLEKLLHDSLLNSGNNHLGSSQVLSGDARKEIFRIALRWANVMKLVYQLPASVVPQNVIEVALRIARHHRHFFGAHIEDDMPDRWEEFCQWQEMIGKSYEIYKRILTSASESRKRSASELAVDVLPENEKRLRTSPNNAI